MKKLILWIFFCLAGFVAIGLQVWEGPEIIKLRIDMLGCQVAMPHHFGDHWEYFKSSNGFDQVCAGSPAELRVVLRKAEAMGWTIASFSPPNECDPGCECMMYNPSWQATAVADPSYSPYGPGYKGRRSPTL